MSKKTIALKGPASPLLSKKTFLGAGKSQS
jgi:hypothetical protein